MFLSFAHYSEVELDDELIYEVQATFDDAEDIYGEIMYGRLQRPKTGWKPTSPVNEIMGYMHGRYSCSTEIWESYYGMWCY